METKEYRKERTKLLGAIKKLLKPHLWESGYRKGAVGNIDDSPG